MTAVERLLGILAAVVLLAGLTACHSAGLMPPIDFSQPGWQVRQGQVIWRPGGNRPALAGELTFASHSDGRSFVQFTKTPFPVVVARCSESQWQIEFPSQKRSFDGKGHPPARLAWLHLCRALTGKPLDSAWRFGQFPSGAWLLANKRSGEKLEGYLSP